MNLKYNLSKDGFVDAIGYVSSYKISVTNEPFDMNNSHFYKKDMTTGEWIYLPDSTPVNKEIIDVRYDWQEMKAYITIADQFRPGPHEFDCTETWTDEDCKDAIDNKFS